MNICMITTTLPPVTGGLETHVWELARRLVQGGHTVTLIGARNYRGSIFPSFEERDGVRIYRVSDRVLPVYYFRYRLLCLRAARLGARLHRESPYDLIHSHQIYPAGVSGALLKQFRKLPLVITCHGSALYLNWTVPWIRPLMKWVLNRTSQFITVGGELKDCLISRSVSPSRVTILPNCVDTGMFSPGINGSKVREKYGWQVGDVVVSFVGRLHSVKGPRYFLRMADRVLAESPGIKFLLVGDGEQSDEIKSEAESLGRRDSVVFAGNMNRIDIPDYLAATDILVVPSLAEGGGLSCLEGMAMAKAVVANRVGALPDLITDGETGLLVDTGCSRSSHYDSGLGEEYLQRLSEAVLRFISDPLLRRQMGDAARQRVEELYSWKGYIKKLIPIYEEAIFKL